MKFIFNNLLIAINEGTHAKPFDYYGMAKSEGEGQSSNPELRYMRQIALPQLFLVDVVVNIVASTRLP